ncbi:hypothetical protein F4808DRAFT_216522 [Astrocystis sublimbata]|nr:hypothetical protein F4808DRAFT_216522 [Astrocystis sublimbata]
MRPSPVRVQCSRPWLAGDIHRAVLVLVFLPMYYPNTTSLTVLHAAYSSIHWYKANTSKILVARVGSHHDRASQRTREQRNRHSGMGCIVTSLRAVIDPILAPSYQH